MLATQSPFPQYFDTDGSPLDAGRLYFGLVNQNPETSPATVYWDAAGTQPAAQPIETLNGYTYRSGSPAQVYAATDYSLAIRDRRGRLVLYSPNSSEFSLASAITGIYADLANEVDTAEGATLVGWRNGKTVRDALELFAAQFVSVKDPRFGALGNSNGNTGNGTDDTAAIQAAIDYVSGIGGGTVYLPKSSGHYRITSGLKLPSYVTLIGPGVDRYPYNGGATATTLLADFASANQWAIEPKTTVGGSAVAYNVAITVFPSGPTYNCAVMDLQVRAATGGVVPYGGIRMHGCPGSVVNNVSIVGTGCGLFVNECYGGEYVVHTITLYYGVAAWQDANACVFDTYSTVSNSATKTVPAGYQLPFMTALNGLLTGGTYNLSTNTHYNRCWGLILGANSGSTSAGNTVATTVEGFSGGVLELFSVGVNFTRCYVEGAAGEMDFGRVAAQARSFSGNFHAFQSASGVLVDIGSFSSIDIHVNGLITYSTFGTVYLGVSTMLVLRQCLASQFGATLPIQYNVIVSDDVGAWINATLIGPWATVAGATPGYKKNGSNGNTDLTGRVGGGALNNPAFTLPAGYRPSVNKYFAVSSNAGATYGSVLVNTAGQVIPVAGNVADISLDGISFKQEA